MSYEEKKNKTDLYQYKIFKIRNNSRYHILGVHIRGLLSYVLTESNYLELNKSLEKLSECNDYKEISDQLYAYNEFGETEISTPRYNFQFKIKTAFPFLACNIMKVLPKNHMANLLKGVAKTLEPILGTATIDYLKYQVTRLVFENIKTFYSANTFSIVDRKIFENYMAEVGPFIGYKEKKGSIEKDNERVLINLEQRCKSLMRELGEIIQDGEANKDEIIPIHELRTKSRIPWGHFSAILKQIEDRYGNKFVITDTCFIPRSKARELKLLLRDHPAYADACLRLEGNGVPRECISGDVFYKLGFSTKF